MRRVLLLLLAFGLLQGSIWAGAGRTLQLQSLQQQSLQPAEPLVLAWPATPFHESVHIYFSADQGRSWWMMARELRNTGSFSTFVPASPGQAIFKVVDSKSGELIMSSQAALTIQAPVTAATQLVTLEAESGMLSGPMKIVMDGQAFNNQCVSGYNVNRRGSVEFIVNVPVAGTYAIWARVLGKNDVANSFFASVDNQTEFLWDLKKNNQWNWDCISDRGATGTYEGNAEVDPVLFSLTAGPHLLRIRNREKLTLLDQIRITNDLSHAVTAEPERWLGVLAPSHAQIIAFGHPFEIKWESKNVPGLVNIDLSRDQGTTFAFPIVHNTENDGSYIWNVPKGLIIGKCVIRIQAVNNNGLPQDASDGYFAIIDPSTDRRTIIVQNPNGGETLVAGQTCFTRWTTKNYWGKVNVYFSHDNGASWQTIAYNRDTAKEQFTFDWIVPNTPTTQALLRVADGDADFPFDVSDKVFTIVANEVSNEYLELIAPNGTEKWAANSLQHVKWISYNMANKVHLDLSLDNGNTWQRVLSDQPANGYINWIVPNTPAQKCKMRVLDALDGSPLSSSANSFSIVAAGTPEENPTPVPPGNYALSFDGLNDLLQIANHPSLNISNAFTIEFWLKTDKPAQNWARILEKGMWDEYSVSFYSTKGKLCASLVTPIPSSTPRMVVTHGPSTTSLNANTWYHVAVTFDGAAAKLYINGKLETSKELTAVAPRSLSQNLIIGAACRADQSYYPFKGVLDEVRLWNVARTSQQIGAAMNATMVGDESGLVACYSFDEGSGQYAGDRTANANHGWLGGSNLIEQGDPTWVVSDRPAVVPSLQPAAPLAQEPENANLQPKNFALHANYPNPFNSQTTIRFVLPESRPVRLAIYDVSGRLVKTLAKGSCNAGEHSVVWDGLNEMGEVISSGVYFYCITAGDWSATRRLVMVK